MSLPRLRILDRARIDLAGIQTWLTQPGSGRRGRARYVAVVSAMLDFQRAPLRWPVGEQPGIRDRPVEGHRIYYRADIEGGWIEILRIFGPYQDRSEP